MPIKKSKNGVGIQRRWIPASPDLDELMDMIDPDGAPRASVGHWEVTTAKQRKAERAWEEQVVHQLQVNTAREIEGKPPLTFDELYAQEHAAIEERKGLS